MHAAVSFGLLVKNLLRTGPRLNVSAQVRWLDAPDLEFAALGRVANSAIRIGT